VVAAQREPGIRQLHRCEFTAPAAPLRTIRQLPHQQAAEEPLERLAPLNKWTVAKINPSRKVILPEKRVLKPGITDLLERNQREGRRVESTRREVERIACVISSLS